MALTHIHDEYASNQVEACSSSPTSHFCYSATKFRWGAHGLDPGCFRRGHHAPPLFDMHRQGIFTGDMLACLRRRHHNLGVGMIGRRHIDKVNVRSRQ